MKSVLKVIGYGVVVLIALLVVSYSVMHVRTTMHMNRVYQIQPAPVSIPTDSNAVAWGKHLAVSRGCLKCHGDNLSGKTINDDFALGLLVSTNLTGGRGGVAQQRSDGDWVRAIRHGVGADGKPLIAMPSQDSYYMSDEDLGSLIAYIKQVPPVDNEVPENKIGPLARVLYQFGKLDVLIPAEMIQHDAPRPESPLAGVTPEYGRYLVRGNCQGCHGETLAGGPPLVPGFPPVANLTKSGPLANWQEPDFIKTMRTGQTPEGKQLDSEHMPWKELGQMTDTELRAVWTYLHTM